MGDSDHSRSLSCWRYRGAHECELHLPGGLHAYKETIKQFSALFPSLFKKQSPLWSDCSGTEVQLEDQAEVTLNP